MRTSFEIRRRRRDPFLSSAQPIIALEKRIAFDGAAIATIAQAAKLAHAALPSDHGHNAIGGSDAGLPLRDLAVRDLAVRDLAIRDLLVPRIAARTDAAAFDRSLADAGGSQAKAVVFIVSDVPDVATLIRDVDHSAQIVLLDAGHDGVDAIASYLAAHKGIDNVYIFSHGSQAQLDLGTAVLDAASMQGRYAADLATIRTSLGANANILVYGCDFARGSTGDGAARLLAQLTGAGVAASTDLTGGTAEGGDFVLEDHVGTITAPDVLDPRIAGDYHGLLAAQNTGAFANTTGTSGAATSGTTVATAFTADGAVKVVITVAPDGGNSAGSITTTTTNATFDTSAPANTYTTGLNGQAALEETLQFGGTAGSGDGANSATVTIAYYDASTGAAINVTNPVLNIDRIGGSAANASRQSVSDSSDLNLTTAGATLTRLSGSSSAFVVTSNDISETVNTVLASGYGPNSSGDPTQGTAAGTVQVNGTYSTLTFNWTRAPGSLNGGDRIDLIFSADTGVTANGSSTTQSLADGQADVSIATSQAFSNPSGLPTTYALSGVLPAGLSFDPATGLITGTLDHDASKNTTARSGSGATLEGTYTVAVTATNDANNAATQTFTIDARNTAPAVGTTTADQSSDDGQTITAVDASRAFSDPNGDPLVYTANGLPGGLSISAAGIITGTVAGNAAPGAYAVDVSATDDKGAATTERFTWTVNDVAPTGTGTLPDTSTVDGQSGISIATAQAFSDPNGLALTYGANGLPAGLAIDASTGLITGTIDHDASRNAPTPGGPGATLDGVYAVAVTAGDGQGGTATQRFTLDSRNTSPVVGSVTANQSNRDGEAITSVDASQAFSDPNGDPLTFTAGNLPKGLSIDAATGLITGTVAADATPGTTTVRIVASDDKGAAVRETFTWTISDVPPAADGTLPNRSYNDSATLGFATAGGFTSPNGLPLGYSATGLPQGLSIDPATAVISGQLGHDASASAPVTSGSGATLSGTYAVTVTASDGQGGSAVQRFTLDATDQAPTLAAPTPNQHGADGQSVSLDAAKAFGDPNPGDTLTFAAAGLPAGLALDPATGLIAGTLDPRASASAPFSVTLTATDNKGAATAETFDWAIDDAPPVAAPALPDTTAADGTSITLATAGGFSNPNGLPLTYSATGLPAGLGIDPATGAITGTLDPNASAAAGGGLYTVAVTADDGQGGSATNRFHLVATNQAPVVGTATPDQGSRDGDTVAPVDAARAFRDPNPGDTLTFAAAGLPAGLAIDPTTGVISGTVARDAAPGADTVSVTARDNKGAASTEVFAWTVSDAPPTAAGALPDRTYADGQGGIAIATAGGFTDANNNPLVFTATGLPAGLGIDPGTGAITGTLDRNASADAPVRSDAPLDGTYTVTVTASDGLGGSASQVFTLDAIHPPPVLLAQTPDQRASAGGTIAPLDVAAAFGDANGDRLTYAATGLPPGLVLNPDTGRIGGTVDPALTAPAAYRVLVVATNGSGGSFAETFLYTVDVAPSSVLPTSMRPTPAVLPLSPSLPPLTGLPPFAGPADHPGPIAEAATPVLNVFDQTSGAQERSQLIAADGIVVSTVNGIAPLNGLQKLTRPDVGIVRAGAETDEQGGRYERTMSGLGRTVEELSTPPSFLGASAIDGAGGADGGAINIETTLRERVLTVTIDNRTQGVQAEPVASFDVILADGRPLPSWLHETSNGLLVGKVPAGVEALDITIRSMPRNGIVTQRTVTIRTDRGTIIPRAAVPQTGAPARHAGRTLSEMAAASVSPASPRHLGRLLDRS